MSVASYSRYLKAKSSVDNRALNHEVSEAVVNGLNRMPTEHPLTILDLGAGTGHTLLRLIGKLTHPLIYYHAVDISPGHLRELENNLFMWAADNKYAIEKTNNLVIQGETTRYEIYISTSDIVDCLAKTRANNYNAILAQAVLDLFDHEMLVPMVLRALCPGGYMYFPITFDGMTTFMPSFERTADELVEKIYHDSMGYDNKRARSQTGRNLLTTLQMKNLVIESVGSSDWIVFPDGSGEYSFDEKYFLNTILDCVEGELEKSDMIDPTLAKRWITFRRNQLEKGLLIYIAHQLDILARK